LNKLGSAAIHRRAPGRNWNASHSLLDL
jgi:hypothetical protein